MTLLEVILSASHNYQFVSTVANRVVELTPQGAIDRVMGYDDYPASAAVAKEWVAPGMRIGIGVPTLDC